MASSKSVACLALMLSLNLLFFSMVSSNPLTPALVTPQNTKCPKLQVCTSVLVPPFLGANHCCPLIQGLVDLDAAICLCAAIKVDIGGIIQIRIDLLVNLVLNTCGRKIPSITCN